MTAPPGCGRSPRGCAWTDSIVSEFGRPAGPDHGSICSLRGRMKRGTLLAGFACAVLWTVGAGLAQRGFFREPDDDVQVPVRNAEYHFVRVEYTDRPEFHRRWGYASRDGMGTGWWLVDWPAAENHFTAGVARLTRVDSGDPRHMRLTDDRLF